MKIKSLVIISILFMGFLEVGCSCLVPYKRDYIVTKKENKVKVVTQQEEERSCRYSNGL